MTQSLQDDIYNIIILSKDSNPLLHPKLPMDYLVSIVSEYKNVPDSIIMETIAVYKNKRFWETKSIAYFGGIIKGKIKEKDVIKNQEEKTLTPIPTKIVW